MKKEDGNSKLSLRLYSRSTHLFFLLSLLSFGGALILVNIYEATGRLAAGVQAGALMVLCALFGFSFLRSGKKDVLRLSEARRASCCPVIIDPSRNRAVIVGKTKTVDFAGRTNPDEAAIEIDAETLERALAGRLGGGVSPASDGGECELGPVPGSGDGSQETLKR